MVDLKDLKDLKTEKALGIVLDFKGDSLNKKLSELKNNMIKKTRLSIEVNHELYDAALIVKKASAQINEIVNAMGIINSLPKILTDNEIIESVSLAAGAQGDGFDLVTNKRIAEFKFSKWQTGGTTNGMRKRHVFADLANLLSFKTDKKKELYVVSFDSVVKYFNGRANWEKVLSKSGELQYRFADYLKNNGYKDVKTLKEIYKISDVEIINIEDILKN